MVGAEELHRLSRGVLLPHTAQAAAASKAKVDCMTNLALVAQKQRDFSECFRWCDKALRCAFV